jgi:ubiquitin-activating enzyme E1
VLDRTGERERKGFVLYVSQDTTGLVSCLEGKRHDLEEGDTIRFSDVRGMTELNDREFRVEKVKDGTSFFIGNTAAFKAYESGGEFTEVKKPIKIDHVQLTTTAKYFSSLSLCRFPFLSRAFIGVWCV